MHDPGRPYDVSRLTPGELHRARRELAASLALARPGSPVTAPIAATMAAIDAELAARSARQSAATATFLCSCGFGTSSQPWLDGHLFQHPGHHQRPQPHLR